MIEIEGRKVEAIDAHVHPPRGEPWGGFNSLEEELIGRMDEAGVDRVVLLAVDLDGQDVQRNRERFYKHEKTYRILMRRDLESILRQTVEWFEQLNTPEERLKEFIDKSPDRIIGFGSVNPNRGPDYVEEKLRKIRDHGFKGIKLLPTLQFFNPTEERMDQIYGFAAREGLAVLMHTGCDPGLWEFPPASEDANPIHLDRVAERYPDLKVIGAHMGCYSARKSGIWFKEMMYVARKHDNVYVDMAAIGGPEIYLDLAVQWIGADKILFATDYPVVEYYADREAGMKVCVDRLARPYPATGLSSLSLEDKQKIFSGNAKRLLGI